MPNLNFNAIDDMEDFSPIPAGTYLCKLSEIETEKDGESLTTSHGDEMWKLRFTIIDGEYKNRKVMDNMPFSENALKRVKFICSRLGIDVSGKINLTPKSMLGKTCYLTIEVEGYENDKGDAKERNNIPYAGYELYDANKPKSIKKATAVESAKVEVVEDSDTTLPF